MSSKNVSLDFFSDKFMQIFDIMRFVQFVVVFAAASASVVDVAVTAAPEETTTVAPAPVATSAPST